MGCGWGVWGVGGGGGGVQSFQEHAEHAEPSWGGGSGEGRVQSLPEHAEHVHCFQLQHHHSVGCGRIGVGVGDGEGMTKRLQKLAGHVCLLFSAAAPSPHGASMESMKPSRTC